MNFSHILSNLCLHYNTYCLRENLPKINLLEPLHNKIKEMFEYAFCTVERGRSNGQTDILSFLNTYPNLRSITLGTKNSGHPYQRSHYYEIAKGDLMNSVVSYGEGAKFLVRKRDF